jgi:hypothetical protein
VRTSRFHIIHDGEAGPLHADLGDAEYTCEACEPTNLSAACEVRSTSWENEYVCKGARSGRRSEQNEIWRQPERRTAVDDADVLREVGYEDAHKDEAGRPLSGLISGNSSSIQILQRDGEIGRVWRGQDLATGFHNFHHTGGEVDASICHYLAWIISLGAVALRLRILDMEKGSTAWAVPNTPGRAAIDMLHSV